MGDVVVSGVEDELSDQPNLFLRSLRYFMPPPREPGYNYGPSMLQKKSKMESQEKSRLLFTRMGRAGAGIGLDDREDFRGLGQYLKNYQEYMNNQQRFTSGLQQL